MEELVESSERLVEVKNYLNDREDVEGLLLRFGVFFW